MLHGEACLKEIHQTVSQVFAGGENGSNAALPRYYFFSRVSSTSANVGEQPNQIRSLECVWCGHLQARRAYAQGNSLLSMFRAKVESAAAKAGISVVDLFIRLDLAKTKSEVRRLIKGGGAKLNDQKITDENLVVNLTNFDDKEELKLSSGKKKHGIIGLE